MRREIDQQKNRGIQSKKRYIWAFIIGTAIFIIGFLISSSISYLEYQRISNLQDQTSYDIFQNKLEYSFFNKDICNNSSFLDISEDLGFQGKIINDLEEKFGKNDKRVLFRKKFYSLIELEHFEFVKLMNKQCRLKINTILFFYSNEKDEITKSEEVGQLLDIVYRRNDDLMIYSFDFNLDSELIKRLKKRYNIEEPITLIINEKAKLIDLQKIEEVEKLL